MQVILIINILTKEKDKIFGSIDYLKGKQLISSRKRKKESSQRKALINFVSETFEWGDRLSW